MEILGVLLAFVGFALGIYEMINTLRGKENKCSESICSISIRKQENHWTCRSICGN